jgi:hypothetical protein
LAPVECERAMINKASFAANMQVEEVTRFCTILAPPQELGFKAATSNGEREREVALV